MRPGDAFELFVHTRLADTFFAPFVFPNPKRVAGKELIDSVVYFSDCLLLVEAKAKEKEPFYERQESELRWAQEKLEKACRQLKGALRQFRDRRVCALNSRLRGTVHLPPVSDLCSFGLILLAHHALPYRPHMLVPELAQVGFPVHVFSARDFAQLLEMLTTPMDFIVYLETRANVLGGLNTPVHGERAFFEFYRDNFEELILRQRSPCIYVPKHLDRQAALLQHGRGADWKYSLLIDDILDRCCATLRNPDSVVAAIGRPADRGALAAAMEELGRYTRLHRIHLGKRLHSLVYDVTKAGRTGQFCTLSRSAKRATVFVATQDVGRQRGEWLVKCTDIALAYWQPEGIQTGLGFATEPLQGVGRSYDIALRRPYWSEEQRRKLAELYPDVFPGRQVYLVDT